MGPSLFFPWLSVNENTRRTIAQKIRAMFVGGVEGAWYDPSDLSTMFTTVGTQAPVTASGNVVGLILDKRLGLALGSPTGTNRDFASSGTDWSVVGNDGTHIVTFGAGSCRYQSDTTSPTLQVSQAAAFTSGLWYRVDVTISAYTSGGIKLVGGAVEVDVPGSVGTHSLYFLATGTALTFTRNSTNVDLTVSSIVTRPVAGNHAYQTTSGARPIFRDVDGVRYLEFDGVDDYLRATFTITQPIDRISAIRQVTWTVDDFLFGGVTGNAAVIYQRGTTPNLDAYSGSFVGGNTGAALGVNAVVTDRHYGANSRLGVNNLAYTVGNAGADVPGGITIGGRDSLAIGFSNIHLHQLIMRGGPTAMTDTQIDLCRKVCYDAAGLPLPGYEETEVSRMWSSDPTATGAWYDPSDLSTMFQESSGATPVTATGQTVGLILDKRLGLVLGSELSANGGFTSIASWTKTDADVVFTVLAGVASVSSTVNAQRGIYQDIAVEIGKTYRLDVTSVGANAQVTAFDGASFGGAGIKFSATGAGSGRRAYVGPMTTTTLRLALRQSDNSGVTTFSAVSVKSIAGNHAFQATAGSRPAYRDVAGLRYLEFDGVDDYLRATFTIAQPIDRISAIQQVTWENANYFYDGSTANFGVLYQIGGSPNIRLYSGSALIMSPTLATGTNGVITEKHAGASSRIALNSGAYVAGDAGASLPGGIAIGTTFDASGFFANMHLYQMIMRGSTTAMTDAQIAACRALSAVKSGVTL